VNKHDVDLSNDMQHFAACTSRSIKMGF